MLWELNNGKNELKYIENFILNCRGKKCYLHKISIIEGIIVMEKKLIKKSNHCEM
jgi:hypothetical protein